MTKNELAVELAQITVDGLEYQEIVALAREQVKQTLVKQSKVDLLEQYLYASGMDLGEPSEKIA